MKLYSTTKRICLMLLLCTLIMAQGQQSRPKVGLVLSGGGARGFAHIGTLALIDSLNIPIDYIAGTSMGGIMGALYSIGYDAVEIERLIRTLEWEQLFSDDPPRELVPYYERKNDGRFQLEFEIKDGRPVAPTGLISGQKILLRLAELTYAYENVEHFDQLPIPYRCVTQDLLTGNEVVLESGSLSKAIRATMSIPSLFDPVEWGDSLLIDGGLLNNVPTNIVKEMGADIVITCNVGRSIRSKDELNTILEILEQTLFISEYAREEQNLPLSDLIIVPEIKELNAADFSSKNIDAIIQSGKNAADLNRKNMEDLAAHHHLADIKSEFAVKDTPSRLHGVKLTGNTSLPFKYLYELVGLTPGDSVDSEMIEERLRLMRSSERIKDVEYSARMNSSTDVTLSFHITENQLPTISGLMIKGNRQLPYTYIYQLLDIHKGDVFDPELIAKRITQLYSLGVFKNIHYEIQPIDSQQIKLIIIVEERATDLMRVGARYDDYFNLVGIVGIKHEHLLIPGLRLEGQYQFAGRNQYETRLLYPINFRGFIAYPLLRINFQNEPRAIYELYGNQFAVYRDRRREVGFGMGMHPWRNMVVEADFRFEENDVRPEVGLASLPRWKDQFGSFNVLVRIDDLDDVLIPTTGNLIDVHFEGSTSLLPGDGKYTKLEITWDSYHQKSSRENLRLRGRFGLLEGDDALVYKGFYSMGPHDFMGLDYYELAWKRMLQLRVDFRSKIAEDWYVKLIYNIAPNPEWDDEHLYPFNVKAINGFGISLLLNSLIGPIEVSTGLGEKVNSMNEKSWQQRSYFSAGFKF